MKTMKTNGVEAGTSRARVPSNAKTTQHGGGGKRVFEDTPLERFQQDYILEYSTYSQVKGQRGLQAIKVK